MKQSTFTITEYNNAVGLRAKNTSIKIIKMNDNVNVIDVKSLTKYTGELLSANTVFSDNKKIKYSGITFSDKAIIDLHCLLDIYIKIKLKTEIK